MRLYWTARHEPGGIFNGAPFVFCEVKDLQPKNWLNNSAERMRANHTNLE
jgi:hypothetical protein